jgi:hypothetical protein
MQILTGIKITYAYLNQIVEMVGSSISEHYGITDYDKLRTFSALAPATKSVPNLYLAAAVDSGSVEGFTFGYISPLMFEDGLGASSMMTWVKPSQRNTSLEEQLYLGFAEWAKASGTKEVYAAGISSKLVSAVTLLGYKPMGYVSR